MEHLLPDGQVPPIRIPNYQPQSDDDGNIATVDECAHVFETITRYYHASGAPEEFDHATLWIEQCRNGRVYNLCYALLNQFFFVRLYRMLGPDVVVADFTVRGKDGKVVLTTANLEAYLETWKKSVERLDDTEKTQMRVQYRLLFEQAAHVLRHLAWFLDWSYTEVPVKQAYPYDDEPLGNTHFACVVLHQALMNACNRIVGMDVEVGSLVHLQGTVPWLKKRMEREGWCPYTIWKLYEACDIDESVYGYALATVRTDTGDHGRCTREACTANNALTAFGKRDEQWEVKHVNAGCDCWTIEAPIDQINLILKEGHIPVLRIGTDDGYKLNLHARRAHGDDDGHQYIAISHVWVDGLGSPDSNIVAQCQLTRIADRLGKIEATESCGELSIWIDTLCIPVASEYSHIRDAAILNMHKIYRQAYAVMIMDADLMRLHSRCSVEELSMRLYLSVWVSRLWTYQEGALSKRAIVMVADDIVDVDVVLATANERDRETDKLQHNLVESLITRTRAMLARFDRDPRLSELRSQLGSTWDKAHGDEEMAQIMFNSIRDRTSSRRDDEAVVIGTYLGLDVTRILSAPAEHRMAALLEAMPFIPANMLFSIGPKLQQPGLHWAPTTFLRNLGGHAMETVPTLVPMNVQQSPTTSWALRPLSELDAQGQGLWTFNPAIKLTRLFKPDPKSIALMFELFDTAFNFIGIGMDADNLDTRGEIAVETKKIENMLNDGMHLGILLPEFDPTSRSCIGVLVEMFNEANDIEHQSVNAVRYCMPVNVTNGRNLRSASPVNMRKAAIEGNGTSIPATLLGGHDATNYCAEWVEPRSWLVD